MRFSINRSLRMIGILLTALACQSSALAEDKAPDPAQVPASLTTTTKPIELSMKRHVLTKSGDLVLQDITVDFDVSLQITSVSEKTISLIWTYGDIRLPADVKAEGRFAQAFIGLMRGIAVKVAIDRADSSIRVTNVKEIVEGMSKAWTTVIADMARVLGDEDYERARRAMLQMMKHEAIEMMMTRDVGPVAGVLGRRFDSAKPLREKWRMPNPLGGPDIEAEREWKVISNDPSRMTIEVQCRPIIDSKAISKTIRESIQKLAEQLGNEKPDDSKIPDLELQAETKYLLDRASGHVVEMTSTHEVKSDGRLKRETTHIKPK